MITFNRRTKVFVCRQATDMRARYDTLFSKAKGGLNQDPFSGHLFLFMNPKRSSIKCMEDSGMTEDSEQLTVIPKKYEIILQKRK